MKDSLSTNNIWKLCQIFKIFRGQKSKRITNGWMNGWLVIWKVIKIVITVLECCSVGSIKNKKCYTRLVDHTSSIRKIIT